MLGTLALVGTLVPGLVGDKVNFSHNFTSGTSLKYDLEFKGSTDNGDIEMKGAFAWVYGEKTDKGVKTVLKPGAMSVSINGSDMGGPEPQETTIVLDKYGMPDSFQMDGQGGIFSVAHLLTYVPAQELEVGQSFTIDWKQGEVTLKGTGKYEGSETIDGKTLEKLVIKAQFNPAGGADNAGDLEYTEYFDAKDGHIQMAKGTAKVQTQNFSILLNRKP